MTDAHNKFLKENSEWLAIHTNSKQTRYQELHSKLMTKVVEFTAAESKEWQTLNMNKMFELMSQPCNAATLTRLSTR